MALVRTALSAPAVTNYNNLPNASLASCAAITVGTTTNIADHEVVVTLTSSAITGGTSTIVNLYAYASIDGTNWSGSGTTNELIDGTDKTITWSANGNQAIPLGAIAFTTTTVGSIVYRSRRISMAAAFGGTLPAKYVIVIQNQSNGALAGSGNSVTVNELSYS